MGGIGRRDLRLPIRLLILLGASLALLILGWIMMIRMPGESYRGALPPLSGEERRLAADRLAGPATKILADDKHCVAPPMERD